MAIGESKHLNRFEREVLYLASEAGLHAYRATSDDGSGAARYSVTRAADNAPLATGLSFEDLTAFVTGEPLPSTTATPPAASNPLDDLAAAIAALAAGFADLDAAVQREVAALNAALAGSGLPAATLQPFQQASANVAHITRTMARDAQQYYL